MVREKGIKYGKLLRKKQIPFKGFIDRKANGGIALFHHSNNTESYKVSFETGKAGRNVMRAQLFAHLCNSAGLEIVEQKIIDWNTYYI